MSLDPTTYRLSDAENQRIFDEEIKPDLFDGIGPAQRPVAVIFGGQPGSGKSAALARAAEELAQRGGAVQIIGDDLREYHPENDRLLRNDDKIAAFYTGPDSSRWVEKAIAYAKDQHFNVIIEGTMRDSNVVAATVKTFRSAGYEIDARVLAVNFQLSEQGIYQRYESQKADRGFGRMTTPEAHQAAYDGLPVTLARIEGDKLADRLTIYRRGAVLIYENELRAGQWLRPPQAASVVEAERTRPLTPPEAQAYREGFDKLAALIRAPGRNATSDEIEKIDQLRAAASVSIDAKITPNPSPMLNPDIIIPDAGPLVHLAQIGALHLLHEIGERVVVVDIVAIEVTRHLEKPGAQILKDWLEAGQKPGSNAPIYVEETTVGFLLKAALVTDPHIRMKDAGEVAMAQWLAAKIQDSGDTAMVLYENAKVPRIIQNQGLSADIDAITTQSFLILAEHLKLIPSAAKEWERIINEAPTTNDQIATFMHRKPPDI